MKRFTTGVAGAVSLGLLSFAASAGTGLFAYGQFRRVRGLVKGYSAGRKGAGR